MKIFDALLARAGLVRASRYRHLDDCYHAVFRWWQREVLRS